MATGKEIRISIVSALNAAGIEATKTQIDSLSRHVANSMARSAESAGLSWTDFFFKWKTLISGAQAAWTALRSAFSESFKFETLTAQFKFLVGGIDEAKAHLADLKTLGDTPPFSVDEFARASRQMIVMSDGVLGYKSSLKLVGDAAAATGVSVEQMAHAVGRLYAYVRDGQPLGRAVAELRNMGVLAPEVAQKLQDMQKAGVSNAEIWAEVEKALSRFNGTMAAVEKTGDGLMSTIGTRLTNIWRQFSDVLNDHVTPALEKVAKVLERIENSKIATFAGKALVDSSGAMGRAALQLVPGMGPVTTALNGYHTVEELRKGLGEVMDTDAGKVALNEGSYLWQMLEKLRGGSPEERKREIEKEVETRETKEKSANRRIANEKERLQNDLAEHQMKIDKANAEKIAEEKRKADEKALRSQIWELRREYAKDSKASSEAQNMLAVAENNLQQAWIYYKDPEALREKQRADEEEAYLHVQFERDFNDLNRRTNGNWREAENLSVHDEAIRGVALAQEERDAAAQWAEATASATKECADTIGRIEQLLHEAGGD